MVGLKHFCLAPSFLHLAFHALHIGGGVQLSGGLADELLTALQYGQTFGLPIFEWHFHGPLSLFNEFVHCFP